MHIPTGQIASQVREELLARFLRYVAIDTQSDPTSTSFPSTSKQLDLLHLLCTELQALGIDNAHLDSHGYCIAHLPASEGCEEATPIGFVAHVDTSPDLSGKGVQAQIISSYDGGDIALGKDYVLSPQDFPELSRLVGHTLITTDGSTLLGADDKAGVAEIMTLVSYLIQHPEIKHGRIGIAFTPDEEIGKGVDHFDVPAFGVRYAYTIDGSVEGELEYENFNAASADILIHGRNVHPGYAKDKMVNALQIALDLHAALPEKMRPECTEGYEGFYHLHQLSGSVEEAKMHYIIRDHDRDLFEDKKQLLTEIVQGIEIQYKGLKIELSIQDQYYNMHEQIAPHMELVDKAQEAMLLSGVTPLIRPIRGGTDGARLSYMGLPCPNIFAGGANFHGRYEYASLCTMSRAVETLVRLCQLWS